MLVDGTNAGQIAAVKRICSRILPCLTWVVCTTTWASNLPPSRGALLWQSKLLDSFLGAFSLRTVSPCLAPWSLVLDSLPMMAAVVLILLYINRLLDVSFICATPDQIFSMRSPSWAGLCTALVFFTLAGSEVVFRYLKGTQHLDLLYKADSSLTLDVYTDSEWAGCLDTWASHSGNCFILGSSLLSWFSRSRLQLLRPALRLSTELSLQPLCSVFGSTSYLQFFMFFRYIWHPSAPTVKVHWPLDGILCSMCVQSISKFSAIMFERFSCLMFSLKTTWQLFSRGLYLALGSRLFSKPWTIFHLPFDLSYSVLS